MGQWNGAVDRIVDLIEMQNPIDPNDPKAIERNMNRMLRVKRRQEAKVGRVT